MGSSLDSWVYSQGPPRPFPFCLNHSTLSAVSQTCSTFLLYILNPRLCFLLFPPKVPFLLYLHSPVQERATPMLHSLGFFRQPPAITQSPFSAPLLRLGLIVVLHLPQNVLSHFLAFVLAVSSACEYLRAKTLSDSFCYPYHWQPFIHPTNIIERPQCDRRSATGWNTGGSKKGKQGLCP